MRKFSLLLVLILVFSACTKRGLTPEGPTDVRIRNITDKTFTSVFVDTGGGEHNYGDIAPQSETEYHRFDKAYPDAEVVLLIDGLQYTNGEQDYTYATYIGPDKITYVVYTPNLGSGVLEVDVILDGPIDD